MATTRDSFVNQVDNDDQLDDGYFNGLANATVPIGGIIPWLKTFNSADSGTTDGTTASKLIQSGQNFLTTISIGMIVYNTTDSTWAYVTAVDNDTTLSISADIMVSGEDYTIYSTPRLPDGWAECDGSVLSDAASPYNGATIPDLNGDNRFLKADSTSGTESATTATSSSTAHDHGGATGSTDDYGTTGTRGQTHTIASDSAPHTHADKSYTVVMIMRTR